MTGSAFGWGAHGHRMISYLALDGLPPEAPEWFREPSVRHKVAFMSSEADRWRGSTSLSLNHVNKPDHFLDIELLDQFGLTIDTIPPLRGEYLRVMAVAKHVHPDQVDPYDAEKDRDRTKEWPGYLPHAITEQYAKLRSSFTQIRILEELNDPARAAQLEQSRANAIYQMGMLSHFVGDAAQPLHTTRHYNGWDGPNPNAYTTDKGFHSFIDSGVVELHKIDYDTLRETMKWNIRISNPADPWLDTIEHIKRSFRSMETLYRMEKDGTLRSEPGKALIAERMQDGAAMLGAMYWSAWVSSVPTPKQKADFLRFDEIGERLADEPRPATQPVTTQPAAARSAGE
jgi:hypothetical protein